ncbi:MAG TPA: hypothetical protein PLC88_00210 [Syntrophomonas sp.]|nr:hypothetical protein [Syntrophomonas sp.]HRW11532.1 hypothetical protein [Syntrophomonas sp.]
MRRIKKTYWLSGIAVILLLALVASAGQIMDYYEKSKLQPDVELQSALKKMPQLNSFRYRLQSGFTVDNREEVISRVEGETTDGNTHIKGEMVNTPIDIYYIDRTIYNWDSFSQKWLVIESGTSNSGELLISELNPLSNFQYKNVQDIKKIGFTKVDGEECLVVGCKPSLQNQLLESLWKNFEYRLWIDFHNRVIKKAVLTAVNQRNEQTRLKIEAEFFDINKKITIKPPERTARDKK